MIAEYVVTFAALLAVIVTQMAAARAFSLFGRYLWLDEIVTWRLVSVGSTRHMLRTITSGLDTNPPVFHLLLRGLRPMLGRSERWLRAAALCCMVVALVGVYACVRDAYSPAVAFAAAVSVWAHPLTRRYAFEVRMYGSWFAVITWCAWMLGRAWSTPLDPVTATLLVSLSFLSCMLHTLGVIALALVVCAQLAVAPGVDGAWTALTLASAGPLAMLAWLPFLRRQERAYSATWIQQPTRANIVSFMRDTLFNAAVWRVLAVMLLVLMMPVAWGGAGGQVRWPDDLSPLARLASLTLLPVLLIVMSSVTQPLLVDRYAIPSVAGLAVVSGLCLSGASHTMALMASAALWVFGVMDLRRSARASRENDERCARLVRAIQERTRHATVVFESPHELYQVAHYAPDLAGACCGLYLRTW